MLAAESLCFPKPTAPKIRPDYEQRAAYILYLALPLRDKRSARAARHFEDTNASATAVCSVPHLDLGLPHAAVAGPLALILLYAMPKLITARTVQV